ncbi:MAG: ArnT family glycosyltransferase [Desulforhopalus sp.]
MNGNASNNQSIALKFILLLGCYFLLHIGLRVVISDSLDYDEAEQALLGQWLLPGYTDQPPLYTWLQYGLFALLGKNVFAVSLLKNSLLFLTYLFVFLSSREILRSDRAAVLATASLLFIPQIAWESQRDMTHTTLVVFASAATLWQTLRLLNRRSLVGYAILGLLLGIGILAKANYGLFAVILLLALLSFAEGRAVVFSPKILVSLLLAVALAGPYLSWMIANQDIVFSATHKFNRGVDNYYAKGIISLFTNSLLFLTPFWCIFLLVFPAAIRPRQQSGQALHQRFITRYMTILFLVLIIVVLLFKVTYVKDRWLQPLLFCAPIFFFSRLDPMTISPRRFRWYLSAVIVAALGVYTAFTIRVVGASYIHNFCRLNYPFAAMAEEMRSAGFTDGLIISDNRFLAGNMHFQFPANMAIVPGYQFEQLPAAANVSSAAVIWKAEYGTAMPAKLARFLMDTYNIDPGKYPLHVFSHRYKFARTENVTLAMITFPLPASPAR